MIVPVPWRWLESTESLQREAFGVDVSQLAGKTVEVDALKYYLTWNALAAMVEIAEMTVEFAWKPWAVDEMFVNAERVTDEAVDVNHFLANILRAAGVDDDQYEARYQAKQDKNRHRMATGTYSARKGALGEGSEAE